MKKEQIKEQQIVFNVRVRICNLYEISSDIIPKMIHAEMMLGENLTAHPDNEDHDSKKPKNSIYDDFKIFKRELKDSKEKYKKDICNEFLIRIRDTKYDYEDRHLADSILDTRPLVLATRHIDRRIHDLANDIPYQDFSVCTSNFSQDQGSWIIEFNLIFNTIRNLHSVYTFVKSVVKSLSEDQYLTFDNLFNVGVTATPDTDSSQKAVEIKKSGGISSFLIISAIALTVSLIACALTLIVLTKGVNENKVREIVKEETEQVVNSKIHEEINQLKLDIVFDRIVVNPKQASNNDSSEINKTN